MSFFPHFEFFYMHLMWKTYSIWKKAHVQLLKRYFNYFRVPFPNHLKLGVLHYTVLENQ